MRVNSWRLRDVNRHTHAHTFLRPRHNLSNVMTAPNLFSPSASTTDGCGSSYGGAEVKIRVVGGQGKEEQGCEYVKGQGERDLVDGRLGNRNVSWGICEGK